ncbi:hypothetical protein [Arthrobacter sp. FW306-06-A]|uniref:hypothetical protein n=1 Tax=Arthrobacter sp. FW306-06-A TaxID=2879621 RepID=UPI001F350CB3|nr:hypothetical protein [Arthrobacter sp. FW306-06-A]UKA69566.1 hypothetical protein LFT49_12360 [Arthrobacter sp. FW306-06-A]
MSKTMAEVLGEHVPTASFGSFNMNGGGNSRYCSCGEQFDVLYTELGDDENGTDPLLNHKLAAHQAAALSAAGFGLVADAKAEALEEAANDMDCLERLSSYPEESCNDEENAAVEAYDNATNNQEWLRARAAALRAVS